MTTPNNKIRDTIALLYENIKRLTEWDKTNKQCRCLNFVYPTAKQFVLKKFGKNMKKIIITASIIVLTTLGIFLVTTGFPLEDSDDMEVYNLVFITIDTLRADHLGCYGYFRNTSPFIDELAKKGFVFNNAIVSAPYTAPSHASMFTGKYPTDHGVLTNGYKLKDHHDTLAEILKRNGYNTAAFIAARKVVGEIFGFNQGFNFFSEGRTGRRGIAVTKDALNWLEKNAHKGKFFTWIHYYDVHCEYNAPEPYFDMFFSDYKGNLPKGCGKSTYNKMKLRDDDIAYLKALYDGEIRYVDKQIQTVVSEINSMRLNTKTIFVITSDHGESLSERGLIGHNLCLYDYEIRVPLIIVHPDMKPAGMTIKKQVESISFKSTILDMLDIDNADVSEGPSFLPILKNNEFDEIFGHTQTAIEEGAEKIYCIRNSKWKFIVNQNNRNEMYSLREDPDELNNLIGKELIIENIMFKNIKQWIAHENKTGNEKTHELDHNVIEGLKSLGYVGQ